MITGTDWSLLAGIATASLSGGIVQIISHRFTLKREEEKYKKEQYQNFYSPIVFKIISYFRSEGWRGIDYPDFPEIRSPDTIFDEILIELGGKLKYAEPKLIKKYEDLKLIPQIYAEDNSKTVRSNLGDGLSKRVVICEEFLLEFLKISNELTVLSSDIELEIKRALLMSKLCVLAKKCARDKWIPIFLKHGALVKTHFYKQYDNTIREIDEIIKEIDDAYEKRDQGYPTGYCDKGMDYLGKLVEKLGSYNPEIAEKFEMAYPMYIG